MAPRLERTLAPYAWAYKANENGADREQLYRRSKRRSMLTGMMRMITPRLPRMAGMRLPIIQGTALPAATAAASGRER